jgi:hypothetical protein
MAATMRMRTNGVSWPTTTIERDSIATDPAPTCWKCARTARSPLLWTLKTGKEVPVHPRCWYALRKREYGLGGDEAGLDDLPESAEDPGPEI